MIFDQLILTIIAKLPHLNLHTGTVNNVFGVFRKKVFLE